MYASWRESDGGGLTRAEERRAQDEICFAAVGWKREFFAQEETL